MDVLRENTESTGVPSRAGRIAAAPEAKALAGREPLEAWLLGLSPRARVQEGRYLFASSSDHGMARISFKT